MVNILFLFRYFHYYKSSNNKNKNNKILISKTNNKYQEIYEYITEMEELDKEQFDLLRTFEKEELIDLIKIYNKHIINMRYVL